MSDIKEGYTPQVAHKSGGAHQHQRPYWKRAHRTVSFWIAVVLMLAAMVIYVTSNDMAGWHGAQPRQPISAAGAN